MKESSTNGDMFPCSTHSWIRGLLPKNCLLIFLTILLFNNAFSQTIIKGVVTSQEDGFPLPGVSIILKENPVVGTTTDGDGNFSLSVPDGTGQLMFSFIGFETAEVAINNRTQISIALITDSKVLREIVVVGYRTVTRGDLTGSVASVNIEDTQKAPVATFQEALAGRVAGVQVSSANGKPGSTPNIVIRGPNSMTQDNSPLYIIDGFPLQGDENDAINPDDIESISVLKDASATSIYGARGANGVIIITTKRGKTGEPVITYNGSYGINKNVKRVELLSPYEFVKLQGDMSGTASPYLQNGLTLEDYRNVEGIDWQEKLFRTAGQQNHSLSLSGGTDKTRYSISGQLFGQEGIILNSDFKRRQGKLTMDQIVSSKLKAGGNVSFTNTSLTGADPAANGPNGIFYNIYAYRPVEIARLETDFENQLKDPAMPWDVRSNPLLAVEHEYRFTSKNTMIANTYAEYDIIKGLKLKVSGGLTNSLTRSEAFNDSKTRSSLTAAKVNGSVVHTQVTQLLNENTLRYIKELNTNHNFDLLGGFSMQKSTVNQYGIVAWDLPNESLGLSGLEQGIIQSNSPAFTSAWTMASGFSSLDYNFDNRYFLTATFRADGSSKFRAANKWGYFPSGAVAWKFKEESFLQNFIPLSEGKVRVSWGKNGNNRISDFASFANLSFTVFNKYSFNNQVPSPGAVVSTLNNLDLKWETTTSTDIGLDLGFFDQRLSLTVDYYNKVTSDLLLLAQLPPVTGYSSAFKNIGKISNRGFEFTVNTINLDKADFAWSSNFNISFNQNKLLALSAPGQESLGSPVFWEAAFQSEPVYLAKLNGPLGQIFGYISDGLYSYDDFDRLPNGSYVLKGNIAHTGALVRASIQPGDIKYRDINNDGVVNSADRTVIGRGYPLHTGGFSNNFKYRQFDLNVFLQWSYGNDIVNANRYWFEEGFGLYRGGNTNMFASYANRWTPDNTNTNIPRYRPGQPPSMYSNRIVEDGSYLRLKTISLGYNLPAKVLSRAKVRNCRIFINAQNLFTWTNYSGYDPEVAAFFTTLTPGLDWSVYPRPITITGGINLSL